MTNLEVEITRALPEVHYDWDTFRRVIPSGRTIAGIIKEYSIRYGVSRKVIDDLLLLKSYHYPIVAGMLICDHCIRYTPREECRLHNQEESLNEAMAIA